MNHLSPTEHHQAQDDRDEDYGMSVGIFFERLFKAFAIIALLTAVLLNMESCALQTGEGSAAFGEVGR